MFRNGNLHMNKIFYIKVSNYKNICRKAMLFCLFFSSFVEFVEFVCFISYTYCGDCMNNDSLVFLFNNIIKETKSLKVDYGNHLLKINR